MLPSEMYEVAQRTGLGPGRKKGFEGGEPEQQSSGDGLGMGSSYTDEGN